MQVDVAKVRLLAAAVTRFEVSVSTGELYVDTDASGEWVEHSAIAPILDAIPELLRVYEAWQGAEVADIAEDGKHNGESALLSAAIRAGYYEGKPVKVVPAAEDGGR